MILDDLEANPDKYKGKRLSELTDDDDYDEENNVQYTKAYYKKSLLPKMILVSLFFFKKILYSPSYLPYLHANSYISWQKTSVKELDLEAALAEREVIIPRQFATSILDYSKFCCLYHLSAS